MRKLFWLGCAMTVTTAAFVYVTARQVQQYPGSMTANFVRGACQAAALCNPMVRAGQFVGVQTARLVHKAISQPDACCSSTAAPCCANKETEAATSIPEVIDLTSFHKEEPEIENFVHLEPPGPARTSRTENDESVEERMRKEKQEGEAQQQTVLVPPVTIVENSPMPPEMPPCDEDAPKNLDKETLDFIQEMIRHESAHKYAELLPMPKEVEPGSFEENEAPAEPMPGAAPDCQEDSTMPQRYPGCPAMGGCPAGKCPMPVPQTVPAPQEKPVDDKPMDE